MIIHIGNEIAIKSSEIVGIFDIENTSTGSITREFLNHFGKVSKVVNVSYDMPKSFILCNSKKQQVLYITNVSVGTLKHRFNNNKIL